MNKSTEGREDEMQIKKYAQYQIIALEITKLSDIIRSKGTCVGEEGRTKAIE